MSDDLGALGWLQELKRELAQPAEKEPDPEKQKEKARAHMSQGGVVAKASAHHLGVGQEGYQVLQAKVHMAARHVKDGDLSSIEQALTEQFFMLHTMAAHYAVSSGCLKSSSGKAAPALVEMTVKCSKASRQVAQTIADLKHPRKTTFVKNQQNIETQQNLIAAEVEALKHQLGQSNAQEMDPRAETSPTGEDTDLAAVEVQHRT